MRIPFINVVLMKHENQNMMTTWWFQDNTWYRISDRDKNSGNKSVYMCTQTCLYVYKHAGYIVNGYVLHIW